MTDDFKINILNYLTGKLTLENGNNEPQFITENYILNNYRTFIENNFPNGFRESDYLEINDKILIYGYYSTNNVVKGGMIILDENFTPIVVLKNYDSGTDFYKFEFLSIDEDNRIYGVDNNRTLENGVYKNHYRFIILNNIITIGDLTGNYKATIRKTYFFPDTYSDTVNFAQANSKQLLKKSGASSYLFIGQNKTNLYINIIKLEINVGSENVWALYSYNKNIMINYIATQLKWDDNLELYIIGGVGSTADGKFSVIKLYNDTITNPVEKTIDGQVYSAIEGPINNIYIASVDATTEGEVEYNNVRIYKYLLDTDVLTLIYTKKYERHYLGTTIDLYKKNNIVFGRTFYYYDNDTIEYDVGIMDNDVYYNTYVGSEMFTSYFEPLFYVKNNFNLYGLYVQGINYVYYAKTKYNILNYNGLPYRNVNCMVPRTVDIYQQGVNEGENILVFARNLYNKTVNDNITEATVEIPNTLLNDKPLNIQNLLSETNITLINNTNNIIKNVYERVLLNFFNKLTMKNSNNPSNEIVNLEGATRLNKSISDVIDYDDCKMVKCRISYTDNSTEIKNITWQDVPKENYLYRTTLTLEVSKVIDKIEFISNDENTVYNTISPVLEVGKLYDISQDVYIENKEV